jgi:hypothetical protein
MTCDPLDEVGAIGAMDSCDVVTARRFDTFGEFVCVLEACDVGASCLVLGDRIGERDPLVVYDGGGECLDGVSVVVIDGTCCLVEFVAGRGDVLAGAMECVEGVCNRVA